jgi:hypothetical protein
MKLAFLTAVVFVISFFAFHNYNKNKSKKSKAYSDYSVTELADLSQKNLLSAVFYADALKTVKKGNSSFQVKHQAILTLNMQSGKIIERNDLDSEERTFCISEESLQSLNNLLMQSKVCKFEKTQSAQVVCAQVIKPAYLDLMLSTENFSLGYASDSCGTSTVDLCDESQRVQLAALIKDLGQSYSDKTCP